MRRYLFSRLLIASAALLLAGCAGGPELAPSVYYLPPADNDGSAAFLKGTELFNLIGYKPLVFPYAVGGFKVRGGAAGWQQLLPVKPGDVDVDVVFAMGGIRKTLPMTFTAKAGEIYEIQFAGDVSGYAPNKYCDVWIVSLSTGTAVTPETRIKIVP